MNEHLDSWLELYVDGELTVGEKSRADAHLTQCNDCRRLVEEQRALSALLTELPPAAGLKSVEQFAAEVSLQLVRRKPQPHSGHPPLLLAWKFLPLPLLGAWGFIQAVSILSSLAGVIPGAEQALQAQLSILPSFLPSILPPGLALSQTAGDVLGFAGVFNLLDWNWLTGQAALLLVELIYICWLASWWAFSGSRRPAGSK